MNVPLLDLKRQHATIRSEVDRAVREVVESQMFIKGPKVVELEARLAESVKRREGFFRSDQTTACRLVHGEADFLPGLVVDRYDEVLVLQASSAGAERIKALAARTLAGLVGTPCVYERSDVMSRQLEGMPSSEGPLAGKAPEGPVQVLENGQRLRVDVVNGQKTGAYLDQRENRRRAAGFAAGRDVLDAFCYTGWFAASALAGGADRVTLVDSSSPALALASENVGMSGYKERTRLIEADVFSCLRSFRDEGRRFDMIFLDPPKLAPTRAHARKASRAYKDLNLLAMKLLVPGGILATFSCSAGMDAAFFQEVLSWAAVDAGREVQIVERLGQAPDHPVRLSFPESEYLKGFICRVF